MKDDEKRFLVDVYDRCTTYYIKGGKNIENHTTPRDLINEEGFYMNYKRAWYLLDKWANKGWYEWGVTMDLGWLTDSGLNKGKELST
jgi:hypothetical protein